MPTTFSAAGGDVLAVLNRVLAEHHPQLLDAGVKVGVLMADGGDGFAAVVVRHGDHAYERTNALHVQAKVKKALEERRTLFDDVPQAGD